MDDKLCLNGCPEVLIVGTGTKRGQVEFHFSQTRFQSWEGQFYLLVTEKFLMCSHTIIHIAKY